MKNLLLSILCLFFFNLSHSQNIKAQGIVTDSLGNLIEMANVMAVNLDLDKMEGYSITKENGQYLLTLKPNTRYQLKVSYLGYSPKTINLNTENKNIHLPILLENENTLLDEIEIVHKMPVSIKGDTIVYNADSFTSGTERKLGDILKKLPGVEVDENGKIKVEGKSITKLMVEGKDFFDGDTKLGVQNIPADAVDKVQVLRNYNEITQLKPVTDNQDNLAMNIKLKDSKKNFWFGDITAGAGPDERYAVNPKLFYYSTKYSLNFITNFNNTGEQPMTMSDYFRMTGGFRNMMSKGGSSFNITSNDLGIAMMQNNKAKEVTNRFGAGNFSYNPTKKWTLSGFGIISDNKTDMETWSRNSILNTDTGEVVTTQQTTNENNVRSEMAMIKLSSNYKPNDKITFDYDIFFKKSQQKEINDIATVVNPNTNQSQEINSYKKQNPLSLNQNLALYYAPNKKNVFAFEAQHVYQDEDPFYNVNLGNKPFDFAGYVDNQLRQHINQERFLKTNKIDLKTDYYYAVNNKGNINVTLGNTYSYQNFNSHIYQILDNGNQNNLNTPELNNRVSYAFNDLFLGFHYRFTTGKLTLNPGFSVHHYTMNDTQLGNTNNRTFMRILPDLDVRFQIKKPQSLQYRFAFTNSFTDITNLAEGYILRGYSNLYQGNRNLENSMNQTHNLHYTNFNMFNMEHIYGGINYSKMTDNINSIASYDGINSSSTSFNSNFADQSFSGYAGYGRTFAENYKFKLDASVSWMKNNIMQINPATNLTTANSVESFTQNYSTSIRTTFEDAPNLELGYGININEYLGDVFYTSSPKINLDYFFLKGFSLTADYTLNNYYNKKKTVNNQYDFLNASLGYKKKESKWEYRINATNILNSKNLNSDNFSIFSISTSQYRIQPTYLIFSLRYNLQ